jgi:hypothetical protein
MTLAPRPDGGWYTPKEFAARLRMSESQLRTLRIEKKIDAIPFGRSYRYTDAIAADYERRNRTKYAIENTENEC